MKTDEHNLILEHSSTVKLFLKVIDGQLYFYLKNKLKLKINRPFRRVYCNGAIEIQKIEHPILHRLLLHPTIKCRRNTDVEVFTLVKNERTNEEKKRKIAA